MVSLIFLCSTFDCFFVFFLRRLDFVTHADGSRGVRVLTYLHNISKTDAANITKRDIEMFHDES